MGSLSTTTKGVLIGIASYVIWGLFPLYWKLLDQVNSFEILCHRLLWAGVSLALFAWVARVHIKPYLTNPKQALFLFICGLLVSCNWGTYIYSINSGHVIEASLGYFINPLVTIVLGMICFKERLTRAQKAATLLALVGVLISIIGYGHVPWFALILACTFATYSALKKKAGFPAVEAMAVETMLSSVVALIAIVVLSSYGIRSFAALQPGQTETSMLIISAMLIIGGPLSALPLLMFNKAANMAPFSYLGFVQYLSPTLVFLLGWLLYGEELDTARMICFGCIWAGVVIMLLDGIVRFQIDRAHRMKA